MSIWPRWWIKTYCVHFIQIVSYYDTWKQTASQLWLNYGLSVKPHSPSDCLCRNSGALFRQLLTLAHVITHNYSWHAWTWVCSSEDFSVLPRKGRRKSRLPHTEIIRLSSKLCCISHCVAIEKSDSEVLCLFASWRPKIAHLLHCNAWDWPREVQWGPMACKALVVAHAKLMTWPLTGQGTQRSGSSLGLDCSWLCMDLNQLASFFERGNSLWSEQSHRKELYHRNFAILLA